MPNLNFRKLQLSYESIVRNLPPDGIEIDCSGLNVASVKAWVYRLKRQHGLKLSVHEGQNSTIAVIPLDVEKPAEIRPAVTQDPIERAKIITQAESLVGFNQVRTEQVPTEQVLEAFRLLLDSGILETVEILNLTPDELQITKSRFIVEPTKRGTLLL